MARILLAVCVMVSACSTQIIAQTKDQDKLPRGLQPIQALASVDHSGKLAIKKPAVYYVPTTTPDPNNKAAMITRYEVRLAVEFITVTPEHFQAYDVRGNRIPPKRLNKLLREEVPVLISADGMMVDPLHLRLYKDDVVVLLAPGAASPPGGLSAAPPILLKVPNGAGPYYSPLDGTTSPGALKLEITGQPKGITHTDTEYRIKVTNTGTAKLTRVRIRVVLPDELTPVQRVEFAKGSRAIECNLGDLDAGALREENLVLRTETPGLAQITVWAIAEPNNLLVTTSFRTMFTEMPAKREQK